MLFVFGVCKGIHVLRELSLMQSRGIIVRLVGFPVRGEIGILQGSSPLRCRGLILRLDGFCLHDGIHILRQ